MNSIAKSLRIYYRPLLAILFIGLISRLLLVYVSGTGIGSTWQPLSDSKAYNALALSILEDGRFENWEGKAFRPPLYPLFLSLAYRLFGSENAVAVRVLQAVLSTVTIVFVFWIGKKIDNRKAGFLAALLAACYPFLIFYTGELFTETLFVFLYMLALVILLWSKGPQSALFAGMFIGIATLCRPSALLPVPFIILWIAFLSTKARRKLSAFTYLIGFILVLLPWMYRNYQVFDGAFVPMTTYSGFNLAVGYSSLNEGLKHHLEEADALLELVPTLSLTEVEKNSFYTSEMLDVFLDNPTESLSIALNNIFLYWNPFVNNRAGVITLVGAISYMGLLVLALMGLLRLRRNSKQYFLLVLIFIGTSILQAILAPPAIRYRVTTVDPILLVVGGSGLHILLMWISKHNTRTTKWLPTCIFMPKESDS